jgi:hypothetical protein
MKFFEKKEIDPMMSSREDKLEKISDPIIRAKTEEKVQSLWTRTFDSLVHRIRTRHDRWEQTLDAMQPNNPIRLVGERVYSAIKKRDYQKIGAMARKQNQREDQIIERAENLSERLKGRQSVSSVHILNKDRAPDAARSAEPIKVPQHGDGRDGPRFDPGDLSAAILRRIEQQEREEARRPREHEPEQER